jgi:predicted peptidase
MMMPPDNISKLRPQAASFQRRLTRKISGEYLLYLPRDYNQRSGKLWPLILFLHGAAERGTSVWRVAKHGPMKFAEAHPDFPFIILAPQCLPQETWSNEVLLSLLDNVTAKHAIDPGRVYLTGLSMGGYGAWALGVTAPERFAALAPICGGGSPLPMILQDRKYARALKTLAVWAFHGAKDDVIRLEESVRMVDAIRELDGEVRFTVYPDAGHDAWTETYNDPALYAWFLEHRRKIKTETGRGRTGL